MLGSIYVLVAVAFTLTIAVLNFLNFSIPGIFMIGGVVTWVVLHAGYSWALAVPAGLVAAALASLVVERLSYRLMKGVDPEVPLVSSLAFLILFENVVVAEIGSDQQSFPALIPDFNVRVGGLILGGGQLVSLALSLALVAWLGYFLKRTQMGRAIRTIAEDRDTAVILGISVNRIVPRVFLLSGLFTGLGGILFAINYLQVSPFMGQEVGFKGIAAMVVGGMGNIWGAVIGGLLVGLTEVLSIHFFGADGVNIAVYGLLLVLLIIRPEGLFGGSGIGREKL